MNVHKKLAQLRSKISSTGLKKTGKNAFSGYSYFELSDFLPQTLIIMAEIGLSSYSDLCSESPTLTIVDVEDGSTVEFKTKSGTAALKGCHDIQNAGAVATYLRRYLWVQALELTESDVLDLTHDKNADVAGQKTGSKKIFNESAVLKQLQNIALEGSQALRDEYKKLNSENPIEFRKLWKMHEDSLVKAAKAADKAAENATTI